MKTGIASCGIVVTSEAREANEIRKGTNGVLM